MSSFAPYFGALAAFLASLSYIPQLRKAWPRGSTEDLSMGMLTALTLGRWLWIVYGAIQRDCVIVCSNVVGATLAGIALACKVRTSSRAATAEERFPLSSVRGGFE